MLKEAKSVAQAKTSTDVLMFHNSEMEYGTTGTC